LYVTHVPNLLGQGSIIFFLLLRNVYWEIRPPWGRGEGTHQSMTSGGRGDIKRGKSKKEKK
jgi:hypothetical protein